jgi:hypothetical protein
LTEPESYRSIGEGKLCAHFGTNLGHVPGDGLIIEGSENNAALAGKKLISHGFSFGGGQR